MTRAVVIHCLDLLVKKSIFIDKSRTHDFVESRPAFLKRNGKMKRLMGNAKKGGAGVLRDIAKIASATTMCYQNSSPVKIRTP